MTRITIARRPMVEAAVVGYMLTMLPWMASP